MKRTKESWGFDFRPVMSKFLHRAGNFFRTERTQPEEETVRVVSHVLEARETEEEVDLEKTLEETKTLPFDAFERLV